MLVLLLDVDSMNQKSRHDLIDLYDVLIQSLVTTWRSRLLPSCVDIWSGARLEDDGVPLGQVPSSCTPWQETWRHVDGIFPCILPHVSDCLPTSVSWW